MAWLVWALLGFVVGILFKLVARTHGPGAWFAGACVGVGGALTGGWIVSLAWGEGGLDVRPGNLIGAVVGAVILLAIYWYRMRHRVAGTEYINPNAM